MRHPRMFAIAAHIFVAMVAVAYLFALNIAHRKLNGGFPYGLMHSSFNVSAVIDVQIVDVQTGESVGGKWAKAWAVPRNFQASFSGAKADVGRVRVSSYGSSWHRPEDDLAPIIHDWVLNLRVEGGAPGYDEQIVALSQAQEVMEDDKQVFKLTIRLQKKGA